MRDLYLACLHAESAPHSWEIEDHSPASPWADEGQDDDEEEVYDCPIHGVVTGEDCPRCGPSPEPEDMTEAQLSRATYHAELMSQGER